MAVIQVPCRSACAAMAWASSGFPRQSYGIRHIPRGSSSEVNSPARICCAATTNSTVVCQCESSTTTVS